MQLFRNSLSALLLAAAIAGGAVVSSYVPVAQAQTSVTGAISGTVTDASGGAVPGAQVTITDTATDARQTAVTNEEGRYTVGLLKPSQYKITAISTGLKSDTVVVTVLLGTTVPGDIEVKLTGDSTVIDVNAATLPLIDTQNVALASTFNLEELQALPTPGGDVTTVAFTLPGVVVNAGGSYGNFSSDGLPGISNLFVLNGFDNQDPFLNLNNSGSSNLTLGQGELAEATVVQNGYNSQYGRAAGAIIEYTTRSGSNKFHGSANYMYNGTVLNANGWFNNFTDTPRPHAVSNEWAANGGGPIIKDKVFFFADYEGLHYVLPASGFVSLPSSEFQAYSLATVPSSAVSTYQQMFNLYDKAPSYSGATPTPTVGAASPTNPGGGCGALSGTTTPDGAILGQTTACTLGAFASANNINIEWLFTGRVDWHISDKHSLYGRYKMDRGSQPTATSYINPAFNTVSIQPEYEGQFNDSYVITPHLTNSAVVAANWYTAYFGPASVSAAESVLPFWAYFNIGADGSGTSNVAGLSNLGVPGYFPQGRNVTQYQLQDDVNWIHGRNTFKFGANFRRDLVEDYDAQQYTDFPFLQVYTLQNIANGQLCGSGSAFCGSFTQAFVNAPTAHLALYNLGVYLQDEWQVSPKLKLTIGGRLDRTGDPLCHGGCFSLYGGGFPNSAASLTTPYSSEINNVNAHPFGVDKINFQPRFGFNYAFNDKTVIRGGAGLFADLYPAGFLDGPIQNFPNYNSVTVTTGTVATGGAGSLPAFAGQVNGAIQGGFATGSATSINTALNALGVPFTPPSINAYFSGTLHEPQYVEYSLQLQHQFNKSDGVSLTYAGNYGYNEIIQNPYLNAASGAYDNTTGTWLSTGGFAGLNVSPADPSFAQVNAYTNNAHSNYSGGMIAYTHQGQGITAHISYSYSHALDTISNGGEGEYYNIGSITKQVTPSLGYGNLNYSNADYDIRNDLVGDVVYAEPFKMQNKIANSLVSGWLVSAKTYYRSGEPYTVDNNNVVNGYQTLGTINNPQGASSLMAQVSQWNLTNTCGSNPHGAVTNPCLDATQYVTAQTTFGNLRRNYFYGPHYANTDMTLSKDIFKRESTAFALGAQVYNIFNHPNFSNPGSEIGTSTFGAITSVQAPPTSPYGSFQSAAVTQRVLVVTGKFTF
ncbi:TonB-dependent receptor [Acidicapsa acidisoli]|uniref:TonB-dependent receptor n=1 Tax=Acidicapsa acidisoli TaxID=1615681 RepID=UPI0021E06F50|nr:carboxypeptidase regulatory-like domain-containing protein [Acidicapsa acidisoli]